MDAVLLDGASADLVVAVSVEMEGEEEEVVVDPVKGPRVHQVDGSTGYMMQGKVPLDYVHHSGLVLKEYKRKGAVKAWSGMSSTERSVMCIMAAKKNRRMREWKGEEFFRSELSIWASDVAAGAMALEATRAAELEAEEQTGGPAEDAVPVKVDKDLKLRVEVDAEKRQAAEDFFLFCMKYKPLGFPLGRPTVRIFCFHNAGGAESNFTARNTPFLSWVKDHGGCEIVAPSYPGRDKLLKHERHTSIETLALELLAVLHEKLSDGVPYIVWGHSVGTWVAFELLILARKIGLPMPLAALLMAFPAPHMPPKSRRWRMSARLRDEQLKGEILQWDKAHFKGPAKVIFDYPFWGRDYEPMMRADFRLFDEYKFRHAGAPKFDFPVHAWHFSAEHYNEAWMIQQWVDWGTSFEYREMQGMGHLNCFSDAERRDVYFRKVADVLQSYVG